MVLESVVRFCSGAGRGVFESNNNQRTEMRRLRMVVLPAMILVVATGPLAEAASSSS